MRSEFFFSFFFFLAFTSSCPLARIWSNLGCSMFSLFLCMVYDDGMGALAFRMYNSFPNLNGLPRYGYGRC